MLFHNVFTSKKKKKKKKKKSRNLSNFNTHREMHPQIKHYRLRKVYQINSLQVLKLKQNFQKNTLVTDKTPFFDRSISYTPFCLS